ncbi:PREDICTED: HLA class II histocompatibility antigen, DP alpha 1 chain-like [Cyprinodon variegatus]|uniref:HLA class II histocompatibility antigen, DP alpha 1 chain-like n=1 Tax=Cyprinodon variegatus TaxID=28743 RepID=UPI00074250A4|nr:PREDICTED: HLA class II histocompatibility antigen, DP alpha 1 chain-like [Cyprinodon variegatus]
MMMMKLLLFLCSVLWVSADVLHEELYILGCSDSDGEFMLSLDGEEKWFADFKKEKGEEPQPPFIDHISYPEGFYEQAVNDQQVCRFNMNLGRKALKGIPLEKDSALSFSPQLGDVYSCSVEHPALQEPVTKMFDVDVHGPQPSVGPAVFCGVGLTIGLIGVAVGTFFLVKGNECS